MLDWQQYIEIADKFQHKARYDDREDLRQEIIVRLAEADRNNGHKPDNLSWAYRIASFTVAQYWRNYYNRFNGIDCGHCSNRQRKECKAKDLYSNCPRAIEVESLNKPIADKNGNLTELGDLLTDDNAIDLDAWLDAKRWLLGCPKRLVLIGLKLYQGKPLTNSEMIYLCRWREKKLKKAQLALF
jgi:DNA-directed RNA polymerase specialized sigma24 family protein